MSSPFDFVEYARFRQRIFVDPRSAVAGPGSPTRSLNIRFLSQGLFLPTALVLIFGFLYAAFQPNKQTTEMDRVRALETTLLELKAMDTSISPDNGNHPVKTQIAVFQQLLACERDKRFAVLIAAVCYVAMVPIAIILLSLITHWWLPSTRLRWEQVEHGLVHILGSHLFWINLANAVFGAWITTMVVGNPEYRLAAQAELAYALLLTLLLGSVSYRASRAMEIAFELPTRTVLSGFLLGGRIRWIVYGILFVLAVPIGVLPHLLPYLQCP